MTRHPRMGHYLTARFYKIRSTLLYPRALFLGTFGRLFKCAQVPNRKALFDLSIAGPLAGLW